MCPVTGETIGHSLPTPQAATKTNTDKISSEPVNQEKQEKPANSQKEGETNPVQEKREMTITVSDITQIETPVAVTEPEASPTPETSTPASPTEATPAKPVTPKVSVAVMDPSPTVSAISSSEAAPVVKTRRVPPGGHTHALW